MYKSLIVNPRAGIILVDPNRSSKYIFSSFVEMSTGRKGRL
jgi:hypothetical protein